MLKFKIRNLKSQRRAGLSLLEVLVSMFIMLFGLLGVAAMFPAGKYHMNKAARYDSAAAFGQATFNDLVVRGVLDRSKWIRWEDSRTMADDPANGDIPVKNPALDPGRPPRTNPPYQFDPFGTPTPGIPAPASIWGMQRIFHRSFCATTNSEPVSKNLRPTFLQRMFLTHDDLVIDESKPDDEPAGPVLDSSGLASYSGNYSWMFTVAKDSTLTDTTSNPTGGLLRVSVAIFESRIAENEATFYEHDPANTKTNSDAKVRMQGGIGGGQLQLHWPMSRHGSPPEETFTADEELVATGNWIVVSGGADGGHRWFRIISQERVNNVDEITISGADIRPPRDTDPPFQVTLFDKVVSVYEKTIPAHDSTLWSSSAE